MAQALKLEDPGEGIHEVEVREVLVSAGDTVTEGQDVLVVESDKAAVEVPSPYSGTVEEIRVAEGDIAKVGDVLMTFATDGADAQAEDEEPEDEAGEKAGDQAEQAEDQPKERAKSDTPGKERRRAQDRQDDDAEKRDEAAAKKAAGQEKRERSRAEGSAEAGTARRSRERPIKSAPAARRLAREHGIELSEVEPTGSHGHVLKEDVMRAAQRGEKDGKPARAEPERAKAEPARPERPERREPLRSIRRATAKHMARAWAEIPHVSHQDEVDITRLETLRRALSPQVEEAGGKLTLTAFALKAIASTLQEHPRFNAALDSEAEEIVLKEYYDINLAVDTERGLLTPVVRDVDRKSIFAIAVEITQLARRVRDGDAGKEDLAPGTFTLTNVGALGGTAFNPIINHPQVAIVGMARAALKPVVVGAAEKGRIEPRLILPLMLAFDHRVVDGADAARFASRLSEMLADPDTFLLHAH